MQHMSKETRKDESGQAETNLVLPQREIDIKRTELQQRMWANDHCD